MKELGFSNTHFDGHNITFNGFKRLLGNKKTCKRNRDGSENVDAIYKLCRRNSIISSFTGIDMNIECIAFAKENTQIKKVNFIISDYKNVFFNKERPDIIFSSLFCHHFTDE